MMPMWSRTESKLFYRTEDQQIMVVNYRATGGSFETDKARPWSARQLANVGTAPNFDLAADGNRFAVLMPAQGTEPRERQSHIMLMGNFFDEVRQRVSGQLK